MLLLSREDIKKVFTMRDAIEADKKAFTLVVEENVTHRFAQRFRRRSMTAAFYLCRPMLRSLTRRQLRR